MWKLTTRLRGYAKIGARLLSRGRGRRGDRGDGKSKVIFHNEDVRRQNSDAKKGSIAIDYGHLFSSKSANECVEI